MHPGLSAETDEEFNNFMHRVSQVEKIIKNFQSPDENVQKMAEIEAAALLDDKSENIDEDNVQLKVTTNRTVINVSIPKDPNVTSQEAFMREVERDADKRYREKLVRKERSDTLKVQATKAFSRGEYVKALSLYGKAIDQIKDSSDLYTDRAEVQLKLERYDQAIEDADLALRLDENNFKAKLVLVESLYRNGNEERYKEIVARIKKEHPNYRDELID